MDPHIADIYERLGEIARRLERLEHPVPWEDVPPPAPAPFRVYIAAAMADRAWARDVAHIVRGYHPYRQGPIEIVSTWHATDLEDAHLTSEEQHRMARRDLAELEIADALITRTRSAAEGYTPGGRHVEFGYALARGIPIYTVGPVENIFHTLATGHATCALVALDCALRDAEAA